jgi:hypothetical protein
MELPEFSIEQYNIIQQLSLNNNVVVDSVAGSGKTTTILHIAKRFNMNILHLTYNKKLKLETREKAKKLGINNIEVHSYHSFCVKYYDNECFNDSIINKIIKNLKHRLKKFSFDLIVLDEAQDITSLYYELICKIYKDNKNINTKICIFGDKKQSIFDFNKADQRFIEYATDLFNFNSYNWIRCNLPVSFRITYEMSLFINKCLLKEDRIISNKKTNNKPRYIICDCFGDRLGTSSRTFEEVKYYFNLGYKPSDIFILAPSIKSGSTPVRQLENEIKREMPNVMVYVPTNDDEELDEKLLEGKIIFSTFHQTKGLERKVVIIFNFDNSYFEFYKKDANPCICSNELYVATTRGIEHLTLFHHYNNEYLHFIDKNNIQTYCHFEDENTKMYIKTNTKLLKNINTSITDIIKHRPYTIIDECFNQLEIIKNDTYSISKINIPLKISNEKTIESVSEINGIAIPSMFELKLKNKMNIFEILVEEKFEENIINNRNNGCLIQLDNKPKQKKYNINDINIKKLTSQELLYISNCWNTLKNGYLYKICQITNYDWLEQQKLNECINRLTELNISINSTFEYRLESENEIELLNRKLIGFIDCIDKEQNIVYEFKCVQKLEKEHYLQLAIYMYMYELEKMKQIKKIKEINYETIKRSIVNLQQHKEQIIKKIDINNKKLIDYNNNIVNEETNEYSIGDKIKYKIFNEEIGEIIKIYKTTGKVKVKNSNNKNIDIPKTLILSVIKQLDINDVKIKIADINNELSILSKELTKTNNLIDEKEKQKELITSPTKLDDEIKLYNRKTEYVLFNILTNEYMNVKCEFQKLKKMIEYLIYSKYINNKTITDEDFIKNNKNIHKLYFA